MGTKAGERAIGSCAYDEASAHLEKAIVLAERRSDNPTQRLLRCSCRPYTEMHCFMPEDRQRRKPPPPLHVLTSVPRWKTSPKEPQPAMACR
jgi:hypothetical protein